MGGDRPLEVLIYPWSPTTVEEADALELEEVAKVMGLEVVTAAGSGVRKMEMVIGKDRPKVNQTIRVIQRNVGMLPKPRSR